ncbi:porin [Vibrio rotiferianus]|uniref:porin n=1 Tax=Vibrio rotiferianus TaxID=190895 RepID=UPI0011100F71|nr:porin [Vibrio rotiferianus]TMX42908.1 porin [Vibrio rotiferianus]TMX59365.1 porin [Vibrio rotiferianus]TMX68953.1 porin [Vibrio rotiferianus]
MKKAALTTAILTALVSAPSFAATVYDNEGTTLKVGGRAEARFNISDKHEKDGNSSFKDKSRARVYLKGKSQISDDLYGFGKYEAEFDDSSDITNRYFFAGLGASIGEFSYGKQDSAQVMLTDITDTMATFGAEAADIVAGNKDKRENNFLYSGEFDALTIKANFIASDAKDKDSFGLAGLYNFGAFDIGAGYVSQSNGDNDDDQFNLVGQYSMDAFTLGALFTIGTIADDDYTGYELSAIYKPMKNLSLVGVYNFQEVDPKAGSKEDTVDEFAIEAVYKFNGHLRTYAGYKFQQIDSGDDELQAGIRYDF